MEYASSRQEQSWWDKIWYDRRGRVVLWQTPNIWLIGWAALTFISLFFTSHTGNIISLVATASLAVWSLLEVFRGVNYFRRLLGLVVLLYVVAYVIRSIH